MRSPTTSAQAACTAASGVFGALRSSAARNAAAAGRGALRRRHAAAALRDGGGHPHQGLQRRARHGLLGGGRDQRLPAGGEPGDEALAALRVQLAHHVVEEEERDDAARLQQRLALGEEEGQQGEALLALRAVAAQRPAAARDPQLVEVRPP